MFKRIKKLLTIPLPHQYRDGFASSLFGSVYKPTIIVGVLIAVFEVGMMISVLARPGFMYSQHRPFYLSLYTFLLLFTLALVFFCLARKAWLRAHPRFFIGVTIIYGVVVCLWGSLLTAYTHRVNPDVSVFLYVTLCTSIILTLRPWQAIALYGANQAAFLVMVLFFRGPDVDVFASAINSGITSLLAITIASLLYRNRVQDYLNRITIVQQNREINNINKQLQQLVYTDDLTKANNRRYLDEILPQWLETARAAGRSVCIMMFDLDHFKQYNDLYGHQAGDRCLVTFASIVHHFLVGKAGAFVRYGGEEFLLCLEECDDKTGMKAAENIRQSLEQLAIPHDGSSTGHLTVSTGVRCTPPGEDADLPQLVSDADQALYIAKNAGRNRVKLFYPAR